ncbi:MAG: SdiA-regulated domain-containing protein [Ignavibacteriales bacterium]|nr:SdiA-regulated domain-containing protein [Ignavibacteriales bacterium]
MILKLFYINVLAFFLINCGSEKKVNYDLDKYLQTEIKLPSELNEISGICFSDEGKLFGHNDERGIIYQIDLKSGEIIKSFQLGNKMIKADFEDLAIVGKKFFIITSNGILFKFEEGEDLQKVKVIEKDLHFSSKFNIEGLCYDETSNSLLITSKEYPGKNLGNVRAVYSYSLSSNSVDQKPKFVISLKDLKENFNIRDFYPSAITKDRATGNYLILSAKGKPSLIKINPLGKIISAIKLNPKTHPQPEGIAFDKNNNILICDEGASKSGKITIYKMP